MRISDWSSDVCSSDLSSTSTSSMKLPCSWIRLLAVPNGCTARGVVVKPSCSHPARADSRSLVITTRWSMSRAGMHLLQGTRAREYGDHATFRPHVYVRFPEACRTRSPEVVHGPPRRHPPAAKRGRGGGGGGDAKRGGGGKGGAERGE